VCINLLSDKRVMHFVSGWVSYGQKWKTGTGRQYFTDIGLP